MPELIYPFTSWNLSVVINIPEWNIDAQVFWEHKFSYLILVLSEHIFQIKNLGMELLGYIGYYIYLYKKYKPIFQND